MDLLEEILMKHHQQEQHRHFTQKDVRIKQYKGLYSELINKQKNAAEKSAFCSLAT